MKKIIAFACCFLVIISFQALWGQDMEELNSVFDFDMTLRNFSEADSNDRVELAEKERFYLLEGAIASISVANPDPADYMVEVELINGQWDGLEDVEMYKGFVVFLGPQYTKIFPRRVPRNPGPEIIQANSHILVLSTLYGYTTIDDEVLPVFIGHKLRKIP